MKTRFILITVWMGISFSLQAQEIVSLEQCYNLAEKNHPLQVKKGLLTQQTDFELGVLEKQKLPQLQLDAQVTYQSDVVSLPFDLPPNMDMSPPNQEQWKTTLTASQLVYNGGLVRLQQDIKKTELKVKKQEIAVSVNQIKTQINQVYFSVLLLNQTQEMLQNTIAQLQKKQVEVEKLIVNGVASASAGDPLQIKILELQQKRIALIANKNQLVEKLGVLIGKKISNNQFVLPEIFISATAKERPEYKLFTLQKNSIDQNDKLLQKKNYPKLVAFGTGGIGNPGLNMLDNSTQEFYVVGAKLQWNVFDWKVNKKKRQALAINKEIIDAQEAVFTWNKSLKTNTYFAEIEKNQQLVAVDEELVKLQEKAVQTAAKQLKHDLITTADYTAEVNKLLQSKINLNTHKIQLQLAKANYKTTN